VSVTGRREGLLGGVSVTGRREGLLVDVDLNGFGIAREEDVGQYDDDEDAKQFQFLGHTSYHG
jgi:hypothetical protein